MQKNYLDERMLDRNSYLCRKKGGIMRKNIFNAAQREVLDVMSCMQNDEDLTALKYVLVQFLNERLQKELDRLWDNGTISNDKMQEWRNTHFRTTYKQ